LPLAYISNFALGGLTAVSDEALALHQPARFFTLGVLNITLKKQDFMIKI
jgi:hypothetical protein